MIIIRSRRAFTLIELLIVIAIVAITVAASMTTITGPMIENVRAQEEEAFESGAGVFFATLAQDAHNTASVEATTGSLTLNIAGSTSGTSTIVYAVNSSGTLTRRKGGEAAPANLLANITAFTADKLTTPGLYTVTVESRIRGYQDKPTAVSRSMDVLVGQAGGAL